ncbi:replication initiator [Pengzhenrongella sp.]|uniref:replication initiator n=1 Tax=Pengzhenrongella sp. TaxID=2888820 RepID=UPI002F925A3A
MNGPDGNTFQISDSMARELAVAEGVCVRPVMRTVTDRATGHTSTVPIPCGSTRESRCPSCSKRARALRMQQCAEGWHLTEETPDPEPADENDDEDQGDDDPDAEDGARRVRSTRRRQDAPDLPRLPMDARTVGQQFTAPSGKTYRPSMFITLTLASYGRVIPGRGVPVHPGTYDYRRAALDAIHFPKVVDRWVQNLRRCAGYKVQYFAVIEPQKRLAPHLHAAIRGAIPRATIRAVTKATYAQVWWPAHETPVYDDAERLPWWDTEGADGDGVGCYRCPETGLALPTWAQALAQLDDELEADPSTRPAHVVRFGTQVDVKGIIAPSPDADRAVRYLTKYLTKSVATSHGGATDDDEPIDWDLEAHIDRMHAEVRYLPCTPTCANWLRYGVQPDQPGPGLVPGHCTGRAHDRENLGLGGRRVLVSRKWSGKTLTEHRADRAAVVRETLTAAGIEAPETDRCAADVLHTDGRPRFVWDDANIDPGEYTNVIVAAVVQRRAWRAQYDHAKTTMRAGSPPVDDLSATPPTAADAA